jgi:hypothetical protein
LRHSEIEVILDIFNLIWRLFKVNPKNLGPSRLSSEFLKPRQFSLEKSP